MATCAQNGLRGAVPRRVDHVESHTRRVERRVLRVRRRDGRRRALLPDLRERRSAALGQTGAGTGRGARGGRRELQGEGQRDRRRGEREAHRQRLTQCFRCLCPGV